MKTDDVYQFFGSANKACKAIGITRTAIYKWMERGYIPVKRQKQIELLTKGKLVAEKNKSNKSYKNEEDTSDIFLPSFRYYDKKQGMCDVESIHFRKRQAPKIVCISRKSKKEKFSVFTTDNLMQAIDVVDSDGKTVYEGDVCLKNKARFIFKNIEMIKSFRKLGKFKIIGNIFE